MNLFLLTLNSFSLLLTSVYEEAVLRHVWRIGAIPCALPPTDSHLPYLNSLGDTAVDFDIAPPRVVKSNNENTGIETTNTKDNVSVTVFNQRHKHKIIFSSIAGKQNK